MVRPDSRGLILEGIASSLARPTQLRRDVKPRPRSEAKRAKIVEVAIRHFADRGYNAARVEDIAAQLGIAKGSVFQHFKSKDGLFFEAYKKAVLSFPKYMQAPAAVQEWGMDRFQDALLTEELDPGLFRNSGPIPEKKETRIEQFVELLRRAIGSEKAQLTGKKA